MIYDREESIQCVMCGRTFSPEILEQNVCRRCEEIVEDMYDEDTYDDYYEEDDDDDLDDDLDDYEEL